MPEINVSSTVFQMRGNQLPLGERKVTLTLETTQAPQPITRQRSMVVTLIVLLSVTGFVMDLQGVAMSPLVGVVVADLGLSTMEITWAMNSLLIGGAIAVGLTSRLGDIGGHRRILIILTLCGLVGSLLTALAVNGMMLTVGRFLQGLAVATPLAWGMIRPRATASQFQLAASILSLVICIFTPISLVLGGVFLEFGYSWKGIFWILTAAYLAMLILAVISPETPVEHRANVKIDIVGAIGLGVWLTALLLSLSLFRAYGMTHPLTLSLFVGSIVVFAAWIAHQRGHVAPLMDFRNVDVPQMLGGYLGLVQTTICASSLYILLPSMLRAPVETGHGMGLSMLWASMPLMSMLPGAIFSPLLARKLVPIMGPRLPMVVFGFISTLSFVGLICLMDELWHAYLWVFVYGLGTGGCYAIGWTLVASSARPDNMGLVMSSMAITSKVFGALTVALVLMALDPGRGGATTEVYQMSYLAIGASCLVLFALAPIIMVPKWLRDIFTDSPVVLEK